MDCDIWTKLRLPPSDGEGGMGSSEMYQQLKESLQKKLRYEFPSLQKNLLSISIKICPEDKCCWVNSLVRVERGNNKSR